MTDEDLEALSNEELMEILVSLEAIDSTLTSEQIKEEDGDNEENK